MDFTIIIPTYNRSQFLYRSLKYYRSKFCKVIIVDGSNKPLNYKVDKHEKYIHLPKKNYIYRITRALKVCKTKYVIVSSDDDFLVIENIVKACKFLKKNSDYVSVSGKYFFFEKYFNLFKLSKMYDQNQYINLNEKKTLVRFSKAISRQIQMTTALFKKDIILLVLLKFIKTKFKKNNTIFFDETPFSNMVPIFGKHKFLNINWQFRDGGNTNFNNSNILPHRPFEYLNRSEILNLKEARELKLLMNYFLKLKKIKVPNKSYDVIWNKNFFKNHIKKKQTNNSKLKNYLYINFNLLYFLLKYLKLLIIYIKELFSIRNYPESWEKIRRLIN